MKISDLRHRITIQKRQISRDEEGNSIETWVDLVTIWSAVEPIRGREYWAASAVQAENDIRIRIRHRRDITTEMRVIYHNRVYNIRSVIDVNELHKETHLIVRELVAGG